VIVIAIIITAQVGIAQQSANGNAQSQMKHSEHLRK